ncbi:uncharacterized protein LOC141632305 [Silene latifolia]|uniref:uncharacterized protein LOC141632305 n=1 Tax=Silene latifolia TaxID=37657 RepID=UPI003D7784DF
MILSSWNIRGLNKLVKQIEVNKFLTQNKLDIIGILETRVKENKSQRILRNKFRGYSSFCNYSKHYNGRIWLVWNPSTTRVTVLQVHAQVLHCHVHHLATGRAFHLSVVYGSNCPVKRVSLWDSLTAMAPQVGPWVVMGDFNIVRYSHEKIGNLPAHLPDMLEFNNCLSSCGLDDMQGTGSDFTWFNKQDPSTRVYSKLDRILVNGDWLLTFTQTAAQFLPPWVSDHCPALLTFPGDPAPKRQFKFLECWIDHPDFHHKVAAAWNIRVTGNSMSELDKCFKDLQLNPLSEDLILKEKELSVDFWKLKDAEAKILIQRAKIHDIKLNDAGSKFFSTKIKERQQSQLIREIQDLDGCTHHGLHEVGEAFVDYYKQLLGSSTPVRSMDSSVAQGGCLDDHDKMCSPNSCPGKRSKSLYFPLGLIRALAWMVFPLANVTLISLIPKKKVVQTVKDFSLSPLLVIYKTISKISTTRLQKVVAKLVGYEQIAFWEICHLFRRFRHFKLFASWSGLNANFEKSEAYFGGVNPTLKQLILNAIGLKEGSFPFRYLGLPIHPSRLTSTMYDPIILKVQHLACSCCVKFLSIFGKTEVLNSMVFGLENFWCGSLLLPQNVCATITKLCRQLFWGYQDGQRKLIFKDWASTGSIWTSWIRHYFLANTSIWDLKIQDYHSESLRNVLTTRDLWVTHCGSQQKAIDLLLTCTTKGKFSVGKAYNLLRPKFPTQACYRAVQDPFLRSGHKFTLMLALQRKLAIVDRLCGRGISIANRSLLCKKNLESQTFVL